MAVGVVLQADGWPLHCLAINRILAPLHWWRRHCPCQADTTSPSPMAERQRAERLPEGNNTIKTGFSDFGGGGFPLAQD